MSLDDGKTWEPAQIKPALSQNAWNLWLFRTSLTAPDTYKIKARAVDGAGDVQTSLERDTLPDARPATTRSCCESPDPQPHPPRLSPSLSPVPERPSGMRQPSHAEDLVRSAAIVTDSLPLLTRSGPLVSTC